MTITLNSTNWPQMQYIVSDGHATIELDIDRYPATEMDETELRRRLAEARNGI